MTRKVFFTITMVMLYVYKVQAKNNSSAVTCKANEEFAVNNYRCQNTCTTYGRTFDCGDTYKPYGDCYCKNGFARLTQNSSCVSIKNAKCASQLPPTSDSCGDNEVFYDLLYSGNHANGDGSCQLFNVVPDFMKMNRLKADNMYVTYNTAYPDYFRYQPLKWGPHCECERGFARLPNGTCVLNNSPECSSLYQPSKSQCALRGETFATGPNCEVTCYNILGDQSTVTCDSTVTADCYCPAGTYRSPQYGTCVITQDCEHLPQGG